MNDFRLSTDIRPTRYALEFDLDLEHWTFTGRGTLSLELSRPASEVTLHAVDLEIVTGDAVRAVRYDAESQTATLELAAPLPAGSAELGLRWRGSIAEKLRGLYRSTRPGERYAVTQFEAADARRAFPCFDEPAFKARFVLSLVHDATLAAIANLPVERTADLGGGRRRTTFRETPLLSSYLLAFTVGPYDPTPSVTSTTGVDCRVWLPRGTADQALYARDAHARAVDWLAEYTAIPYPFPPKVDAIGIPDFEAGAMENAGAITYRTTLLAADPRTASTATFKAVFSVAAHELTHMWWGDLVTMAWWNDLWLNESFASFVGEKCTAALNPEWRYERDIVSQNTSAFALDALLSTHPISLEARNVDEANERFDAVTYLKGQGVLRMIERYLGAETFRAGVRIYLARHQWANATAFDFWRALDAASGRDVTGLATAWITEPGHPLVRCTVIPGGAGLRLRLAQQRFLADPEAPAPAQRWPVPLIIRYGTAGGTIGEERILLTADERTVELPGATWYFPNGGGNGFFRYALDDRSLALLTPHLATLAPEERLSFVDDLWALARARRATIGQVLEVVAGLRGEDDLYVLRAVADLLTWLHHNAVRQASEGAFRQLVDRIFRPQLERLGWDNRPDDSPDEREKRQLAIGLLGHAAAAADVRAEAARRIAAHLDGTGRLAPDVTGPIAAVAAVEGDATLFDRYVERMRAAQLADPQEEARFRAALTEFADPALSARYAEAIFSDLIRDQDRALLLQRMDGLRHARAAAARVLMAHWDRIATMDPGNKQRAVVSTGQLTTPELVRDVSAFLERHRTPDIRSAVAQALERMRINAATAARMADELDDALGRVAEPAR